MDKRELDRFCCNWDIRLKDSHHTIKRYKPIQVNMFKDDEEFYKFPITEDIQCYDVLIPKDNFHALVDIDKRLKEVYTKSKEEQDYISHVKRKEMIEIRARNNNPAVKKAWDNYRTLMNLVYHEYADKY